MCPNGDTLGRFRLKSPDSRSIFRALKTVLV